MSYNDYLNGFHDGGEIVPTVKEIKLDNKAKQNTKNRNIAALMIEDMKTVSCVFNDNEHEYVFKTNMDHEVGDLVIVDTQRGIRVVTVTRIHDTIEIDINSNIEYTWVIQKVDCEKLNLLKERDERIYKKIVEVEQQSIVEKAKSIIAMNCPDIFKLENKS